MKPPGKSDGSRSSVLIATLTGLCLVAAAIGGCQSGETGTESIDAVNKTDCLPAIRLLDQHSHPVLLSSLKGELVLINFIYTSCPGPCLTETSKMARVADRLGDKLGAKVTLVSVTVDPEHDGPTQMLQYARKQGVDKAGWLFLTGSPEAIDATLKNFKLVRQREDDGSVDHVIGVFLLGPDGRELREYNGEIMKADTITADIDRALPNG